VRDGVRVGGAPLTLERVRLLGPGDDLDGERAATEPVAVAGACVLVRLSGPAPPGEVALEWRLFNAAIRRVELKATSAPFAEQAATPYSPVTIWAVD
jgi:hypothetical protein